MKILAASPHGYIVDMTADEVAKAAGFSSTYDTAWEKANLGHRLPVVGTRIDVAAAYNYHVRVASDQSKARSAAGFLRGLADMLEGSLPDVVLPPAAEATEEESGK